MSKTIKQIADEIGVSKQAIQKRLAREPLCTSTKPYISTRGGTKYIEVDGEKIIKSAFSKTTADPMSIDIGEEQNDLSTVRKNVSIDKTTDKDILIEALKANISILQEQLSVKDEQFKAMQQQLNAKDEQLTTKDLQISEKDKQLADLTAALVSSQEQHKALTDALTAAQALHAGTIQERLTDNSMAASEAEPVEEKKKGFFARLFGKN